MSNGTVVEEVADIRCRVARIADLVGRQDDETAHKAEDELWCDVLTAIANGNQYARQIAAEALTSLEVVFDRWCA